MAKAVVAVTQNSGEKGGIERWLEMLLSSRDDLSAYAYTQLEQSGLCLSNGILFLLRFSLLDTERDTLGALVEREEEILQNAVRLLSVQFQVYCFSHNGNRLLLLFHPETTLDSSASADSDFVMHMSSHLCERYQQYKLQIFSSVPTETCGTLTYHAGALNNAVQYSNFLAEPPSFTYINFEKQNSTYTLELLDEFRAMVLKTIQLIRADLLDAPRSAREMCALVMAHTEYSTTALHRHMDMLSVCLMERLIGDMIVDRAFLAERNLFNELMMGNNQENYTANLERILTLISQRHRYISHSISSERMKQIRQYVEDHISDVNLSVTQIAEHFAINRGTLTENFSQYFGLYLSSYISQQRLAYAQQLIDLFPELSIREVARKAGYADLSTMYRTFQRQGLPTPNSIRKNRGGSTK